MYQGLFEAHITVSPLEAKQVSKFKELSQKLSVKTIEIALDRGSHPVQPMTSSVHKGKFEEVKQEVFDLAKKIASKKFQVTRVKIEAHPDNLGVPEDNSFLKKHSEKNYFEYHLKILLVQEKTEELLKICEKHQVHLSNNAFKKINPKLTEKFVTSRVYALGKKEAQEKFNLLKQDILKSKFEVLKEITEYCVYDDNVSLDDNWLIVSETSPCEICESDCNFSE